MFLATETRCHIIFFPSNCKQKNATGVGHQTAGRFGVFAYRGAWAHAKTSPKGVKVSPPAFPRLSQVAHRLAALGHDRKAQKGGAAPVSKTLRAWDNPCIMWGLFVLCPNQQRSPDSMKESRYGDVER